MQESRTWERRAAATAALRPAPILFAALCALAIGGSAAAQEADGAAAAPPEVSAPPDGSSPSSEPAAEEKRGAAIEEITVTARKREENLQDTPISITAFTANDLQDQGIARSDDIGRFAPNLQFNQSAGGQNSARVQIRGVGTNDPITTRDPGVGIYVDGVYLARAQGQLLGLSDIERIEVLRGPQGTLFGRNTIGGAVNVVSKKPGDEFEAQGSVRFGNYNLLETRGSVNIPISPEMAALRLSFQSVTREGYTKNKLIGQETDDRRSIGFRAALRLTPTDALEILLTGDQVRAHSAGRGGECRFVPSALATAPLINLGEIPLAAATGDNFITACNQSRADDDLSFASPVRTRDNLDSWGLSSTITWDLESFTLKSTTAWRRQENDTHSDFTFSRINVGDIDSGKDQQDQISQELNINGTGLDGRLQWTGGLFAFFEDNNPGVSSNLIGFNLCRAALLGGPAAAFGAFCPASSIQDSPKISTDAFAGYGQLTYDVTDDFHVTTGLRYSREKKAFDVTQINFATALTFAAPFKPGTSTERFDKFTPLINLTYDVTDDAILYATYSRGFKSGGFNGRPNAAVPASLLPFDQEILDNYEIGAKTQWFDNRLVANLSLFVGKYDDIQQTILSAAANGTFASRVANAGKADIKGAELEMRAVPTPGLDLRVNLGVTDAEYDEFDDVMRNPNPLLPGIPIDRSDEDFFNTPNFTATISGAYTFYNLAGLGDLTARLNWYTQGDITFGLASETINQNRYGLLSGQLGLALPDGKTEIAIFGENLLNRRYLNSGINFEDGFSLSVAYFGPPRMYGVEIRRSF